MTRKFSRNLIDFISKRILSGRQPQKQRSHFEALFKKNWGVTDLKEITDPTSVMGLNFALTTVERGERIKDILLQYTEIKGKRCLDVGCAYGGFLVAFKRAGAAEAIGIDVDPNLLEYCRALLKDHRLRKIYHQKDILKAEDICALGTFDIITCNDVIEHVRSPYTAMKHMSSLLRGNGLLFMEIPNRFCAAFIRADGHYNLFGITLLPNWMADTYLKRSFPRMSHSIHYRRLKFYTNTLKGLGLHRLNIDTVIGDREERLREIRNIFEECKRRAAVFEGDIPLPIKEKIRERVFRIADLFERNYGVYLKCRERDAEKAEALAEKLILTFGEGFWRIIARKRMVP
ncbi:MAG: hypothetical protein A2V86_15335 [Deltaproteobacteria bacterium RBG_16_49_23]|nr:MAG: hypothetical protein A2V86_15335 [Deltaproteobacteria bacterium RBG_16_49_23]